MKKLIFLFLSFAVLSACSSDDDSASDNSKTKATITLKNASGEAVSNIVVYAYDETTWEVIGDNPLFADFQAASDSQGISNFENIFSVIAFSEINNFQNTFRFSAHYTLNGNAKTKNIAITFAKGETKSGTIILN
jgi:hypothetical protein